MNFEIVQAVESDIPILLVMIRELAEFEKLWSELSVTEHSLWEALCGPDRVAWALLARVAGEPVGYAVFFRTFSTFAGRPGVFLDDLYVRPKYRKQGLGRALLEQSYRYGKGDPRGRYEWIVLRWNENALRFYQDFGARPLENWVCVRMNGEPVRRLTEKGE